MRLLNSEIKKIVETLSQNLKDTSHQVYLFGSRIDDNKKGGDIDLLLLVSSTDYEKVYNLKSVLRFDLEAVLGDQKVDLTLATDQKLKEDPFLVSISDELVRLSYSDESHIK